MIIAQLLSAAFGQAFSRNREIHKSWISISFRVGSSLPNSLLPLSIQKAGELDLLLRSLEAEFSSQPSEGADPFLFNNSKQAMLTELWIGMVYEIFRLLIERDLAPDRTEFKALAHELRLLRIPLEKHEIAADKKLSGPLLLQRLPVVEGANGDFTYNNRDNKKSHIMPFTTSNRGSIMWNVIDTESQNSYWLERLSLSDRIVALFSVDRVPGVPVAA